MYSAHQQGITDKENQCHLVSHKDTETHLHNIFKEDHPTYSLETKDGQLSEVQLIVWEMQVMFNIIL
jgi:hypothetical protein